MGSPHRRVDRRESGWGMAIGQAIGEELQKEGLVPRPPNEQD